MAEVASELRVECPFCDNLSRTGRYDPVCYINTAKETYYCHRCHATGPMGDLDIETLNVVSIKDRLPFNAKSFDQLERLTKEAIAYLRKRFPGVDLTQLESFNLRYSPKHHALAIPTYNPLTKELQGIKYRFIAPMGDLRYIAEDASQFGGYWIDGSEDKLLITEGELDAITARVAGFSGTILALQTNKLSQESITRVQKFRNIFLALDSDKAGEDGAKEIRSLLLLNPPVNVKLPEGVKDFNELLQKQGLQGAGEIIKRETQTEIERATISLKQSIPEMVQFLSDRRNTQGDSTGWKAIDHLFGGGLRPNEMTVVNAFAKTGKTSFMNNLTHNLAAMGKKIAVASFEMDPARTLYPSLLSIAAQRNIRGIKDPQELSDTVEATLEVCTYLNNIITLKKFGYTPWEEIEEWAALMKERFNIEYLVLDHAGFMAAKMTDAEENQMLAKNIKKLTNTLKIHVLVVVQAPKTKDGLSIQTAYGGLSWGMNADNFLILERSKDNESELRVRLEAARYPGANPSYTPALLFYDRETNTLTE